MYLVEGPDLDTPLMKKAGKESEISRAPIDEWNHNQIRRYLLHHYTGSIHLIFGWMSFTFISQTDHISVGFTSTATPLFGAKILGA